MATVIELAFADVGTKFPESPGDIFNAQMLQAELLNSRRIYDSSIPVEMIKPRMSCRVATCVEGGGNVGSGALSVRNKRIDDGGFSHTGLTHQYAEMVFQIGQQGFYVVSGTDGQQSIVEFPVE